MHKENKKIYTNKLTIYPFLGLMILVVSLFTLNKIKTNRSNAISTGEAFDVFQSAKEIEPSGNTYYINSSDQIVIKLKKEILGKSSDAASVDTETIGYSVQNNPINAVKIGLGGRVFMIVAGMHTGEENHASDLANKIADYFKSNPDQTPADIKLIIIPLANPDGYKVGTRLNANKVDLNRNWPSKNWISSTIHGAEKVSGGSTPLSEPETKAIDDYIKKINPELVIGLHSNGSLITDNDHAGSRVYSTIYAKASGYTLYGKFPSYEITGDFTLYLAEKNIPSFDVEITATSNTDSRFESDFQKNLAGIKAVINMQK